jgi:hypothetical protein
MIGYRPFFMGFLGYLTFMGLNFQNLFNPSNFKNFESNLDNAGTIISGFLTFSRFFIKNGIKKYN